MKKGKRAPGGADGPGSAPGVIELHADWLRILDRLTRLRLDDAAERQARRYIEAAARQAGAPVGQGPRPRPAERARLVARARALERRIADTRAQAPEEVILKLEIAACPLLISGEWSRLVESAARDMEAPLPGTPPALPGAGREG